jgi:hypothetical protein
LREAVVRIHYVLGVLLLATGCGPIEFKYTAAGPDRIRHRGQGAAVRVGEFKNEQGWDRPTQIHPDQDLDRPVSDVVRAAVSTELEAAGYRIADPSTSGDKGLEVSGSVRTFYCFNGNDWDFFGMKDKGRTQTEGTDLMFAIHDAAGAIVYAKAFHAPLGTFGSPWPEKTLQGCILEFLNDDEAYAVLSRARQPAIAVAEPPRRPEPRAATPPAPPTAAGPDQGRVFVVVIGVNEYDDKKVPALRFAEQDARSVYGFFATDRKSPTIRERVHLLLGKDATRQGILRAIREDLITQATRPDDLAILYFAGHGFQDADDTYLAGADAQLASLPETAISGATIAEYWKKILAGRKVFLVDACHSGGIEGVRGIGGVVRAPAATEADRDRTSLTIAATGPSELSTEDPNLGQGVFTLALLKGLRGEADADKDGRVTGEELGVYLKTEVPSLAAQASGKQTPTITTSGGATIWLSK